MTGLSKARAEAAAVEGAERNLLATFRRGGDARVSEDDVVRAARLISRGTGQSIEQTVKLLAKALHDPVRGGIAVSYVLGGVDVSAMTQPELLAEVDRQFGHDG